MKELLQQLADDYSTDKLVKFFEAKSSLFERHDEHLPDKKDDLISQTKMVGEIKFQAWEKLAVIECAVSKELNEKSSRRIQYEFAKALLKKYELSAGIFVFWDSTGNFRFSLVYPEALGTKRKWNSFKRFTFFVSKDFTNKTFIKRIAEIEFSSLDRVKEAFAISPVTDIFYSEFFEEYKKIVDSVKTINKIEEDDKARDFVLLFVIRTIFLGFIQKRKWIGDDDQFIQSLYSEYSKVASTENKFYQDWLSLLFFEALNKKFFPHKFLPEKINTALQLAPHLNGGLFKEKSGYDDRGWIIPDKEISDFINFLFSHSFTIEESSVDDTDLQLNPEFLGIIFERLVNKADGAVYTPRTEVDFMCRLSLIKWLQKNIDSHIEVNNLYELFFRESEKEDEQKEGSFSRKEAEQILASLENITICDPAVGSGAFLVGMMQVLDDVEQHLRHRFEFPANDSFKRKKQIIGNSLYGVEVKEWAVWVCQLRLWLSLFVDAPEDLKNSLEPILPSLDFKVRQGDSLVQRVGSKLFPISGHNLSLNKSTKDKITKLKNLKLQYFDNKGGLRDWELRQRELGIYEEILSVEVKEKEDQLRNLKNIKSVEAVSLFGDKIEIKQEILGLDKQKIENLETEISELKAQRQALRSGGKPLVWSIEFAEVFAEKDGFDIIIGNPPYVRQEAIADPTGKIKDKKEYKNYLEDMVKLDFPNDFPLKAKINAQSDLYTYFYIRGLRLLNPQGIHTFICSNSWLDVGYGVWLQEFLLKRCPVELIIDNHAKRSFEAADVNTIISIIHAPQKKIDENHLVKFIAFKKPFEETIYTENMLSIENAKKVESSDTFRVYPVAVKVLKEAGMEYEENTLTQNGKYIGDKWGGKYLRVPDIFFTIMRKGEKYINVFSKYFTGERYLNTGGADGFFIITDLSRKGETFEIHNNKTLLEKTPAFSGDIEAKFLKKLIKDQTKKNKKIEIKEADAWCLVVNEKIENSKVESYINWGSRQGYSKRSVTKSQKPWFKPTNQMREGAEVLLPRSFNDVFVTYYNPNKYLSLRFYRLHPKQDNCKELVAFLNTTFFWFLFEAMGNKSQGQGVLDFYMEDFLKTKMPIVISNESSKMFEQIISRQIKPIFEECGIDPKSDVPIEEQEPKPFSDRAELDKIVFDALGLTEDERKEIYRAVCRLAWNRISKAKSV